MNNQEVQHLLKDMADNCMDLAKRLSNPEDGELTANEQQLITFAHMPMIRECYEMGVGAMVAGNTKQAYEHFMHIAEIADRR